MDNIPHPSRPTRSRLLTALGLLAAGGTILTAVLLRRARPTTTASLEPLYIPVDVSPPIPVAEPIQSRPPKPVQPSNFSPLRWLIFALVLVGISVGLVLLQNSDPSISVAFFVLLVLGSAGIGVRSYPQEARDLVLTALNLLRNVPQFVRAHRLAFSVTAGILSLLCMAQSATAFYFAGINPRLAYSPVRWLLTGLLMLGFVAVLNPLPIPLLNQLPTVRLKRAGIRWKTVILGIFALALLSEINGNALHILPEEIHYNIQIALFVFGTACLIRGFGGDWHWPKINKLEWVLLLSITLLALVLRTVALESSIHRFVDEINFINAINGLDSGPYTRILTPFGGITSFTWIYPWLQSISVNIFGHTLAAVRLVSSLFGALTVPALYFLARTLFDRTTAAVAALLLATFPAHMHFSRIGLNNIADPLFGVLALAFMARAWKYNRRSDYVVAGAMLGLTQYFYEGGRLLFPALAIGWVVMIWFAQRGWKDDREKAVMALIVMVLVAAPVYYTAITTQGAFSPRLNSTAISLKDWVELFRSTTPDSIKRYERFAFPLLTYINLPDQGWFYGGHQALILSALLPIFLFALGILIWHIRSPGALLLLLWVVGTSLGNMLLYENDWSPRFVVVFPALALILALGISYGLSLLWRWRGRTILIVALTLAAAGWQVNYYFNEHLPLFAVQFRPTKDIEDLYFRLQDIPADTEVHIFYIASVWQLNLDTLITFWNLPIRVDFHYPQELTPEYLASLPRSGNQAFFIDPDDVGSLDLIRQYFYLLPPRFSPYDVPQDQQMGLYYAPRFTRS